MLQFDPTTGPEFQAWVDGHPEEWIKGGIELAIWVRSLDMQKLNELGVPWVREKLRGVCARWWAGVEQGALMEGPDRRG
jgi:hypothetical protein